MSTKSVENIQESKDKVVEILWTGGWDSTFRIIELSMKDNIVIQPVYIEDPNRKSVVYEKKSMNEIIAALKMKPKTKAKFAPITIYKLQDIPKDEEISKAYYTIYAATHLGAQHEWLAWLGKLHPGMEMGTEKGSPEMSHIIDAIERFCDLQIEDGYGRINHEKSSKEGNLVLGWFTFPIITRTETDMLEQIKDWGYEDIMKHIWFCHKPVNGKPCGLCHPCDVKMESKMEWLLPKRAQRNYKIHQCLKKICGNRVADKLCDLLIRCRNTH